MSGIIYFASGKQLKISEKERELIAPKLQSKGIKIHKTIEGHLIPLNSNTMEMIEFVPEEEIEVVVPTEDGWEKVKVEVKEEILEKEEEPKKSMQDKQDEAMKDILAKSDCVHDKQDLYVQHTLKGIRYFPVCSFCGKRERYISEKNIIDGKYPSFGLDDIKNAKEWVKE